VNEPIVWQTTKYGVLWNEIVLIERVFHKSKPRQCVLQVHLADGTTIKITASKRKHSVEEYVREKSYDPFDDARNEP
jgi:hypothetical protein